MSFSLSLAKFRLASSRCNSAFEHIFHKPPIEIEIGIWNWRWSWSWNSCDCLCCWCCFRVAFRVSLVGLMATDGHIKLDAA